jgi:simple sugar transport system permease protein
VPDVFSVLFNADYLDAVIRISGPLMLAALACLLCSRAGILNIAIEGVMLIAVLVSIGAAVWTQSILVGICAACVAGVVANLGFGFLSIALRMGDVIGGLVIHIGSLGLTAFLQAQLFPKGATTGGQKLAAPWTEFGIPLVDAVLHQEPLVYVAVAAMVGLHVFFRTKWGLRVRASGESTRVAAAFGVHLGWLRVWVLIVSGILAGLAGAVIGLAIAGTFDVNAVGGRGFVALACVILGAWRPLTTVAATLLFGATYALQFRLGGSLVGGWVQMLPYLLTLVAIAAFWGRSQGPVEEGRGVIDTPGGAA